MIKEHLKNKSPDYIEGFLNGVKLFAWWKDGVEYVGTCGKTYLDVLNSVNELLQERAETNSYPIEKSTKPTGK